MGKAHSRAISAIFDDEPKPSSRMNTGYRAILGTGYPKEKIGSNIHSNHLTRAMSTPNMMPATTARPKPLSARVKETPVWKRSSPLAMSASRTEKIFSSGGMSLGDTHPDLDSSSQIAASTASGYSVANMLRAAESMRCLMFGGPPRDTYWPAACG